MCDITFYVKSNVLVACELRFAILYTEPIYFLSRRMGGKVYETDVEKWAEMAVEEGIMERVEEEVSE